MRKCAFCPNTASLTAEHLYSDWISKLLEARTHHYSMSFGGDGRPLRNWHSRKLDLQARVTCEACNSGWMSRLENKEAKPILKDIILHDAAVSILPPGLGSIAAFTMKCGFVADYLTRHRAPFFDAAARQCFAKTLKPPEGVHMWMGRIQQRKGMKRGIYKARYGDHRPFQKALRLDVYVFTFSVEALLLQLAAVRFIDNFGDSAFSPQMNQEARLNDLALPFWPPGAHAGVVSWPPRYNIQHEQLESFASRFVSLNVRG